MNPQRKKRLVDKTPVLTSLRALGYRKVEPLGRGVRDAFSLSRPDNSRTTLKIQMRNASERAPGQYRFGVCFRDFANVEAFVFWVDGQEKLLIVQTPFLAKLMHECQTTNRFANQGQWEVVIHFDSNKTWIKPFGSGSRVLNPTYQTLPSRQK